MTFRIPQRYEYRLLPNGVENGQWVEDPEGIKIITVIEPAVSLGEHLPYIEWKMNDAWWADNKSIEIVFPYDFHRPRPVTSNSKIRGRFLCLSISNIA